MKTKAVCNYKGFLIERGLYGNMFSFQYCGDDLTASTLEKIRAIIDDIITCELEDVQYI